MDRYHVVESPNGRRHAEEASDETERAEAEVEPQLGRVGHDAVADEKYGAVGKKTVLKMIYHWIRLIKKCIQL